MLCSVSKRQQQAQDKYSLQANKKQTEKIVVFEQSRIRIKKSQCLNALELRGMVWRTLEEKRAHESLRGRGTERTRERDNWQAMEHVANCDGRSKRTHVDPHRQTLVAPSRVDQLGGQSEQTTDKQSK